MTKRIVYKTGILALAREETWSQKFSQKLNQYIESFMEIGTPEEIREFVYANVPDSYPQGARIKKYVEEKLNR